MKKVVEKSKHTAQVQGQPLRRWSEEGGAGVRCKERKGKRGQIGGGAEREEKLPVFFCSEKSDWSLLCLKVEPELDHSALYHNDRPLI